MDRFFRRARFQYLDRPAHCTQRISDLMREPCSYTPNGSKAIFSTNILFHRADLGKVLKCDYQAGSFICFREQQRNTVPDMDRKTLRRYQIGLEPRRLIRIMNFAKCQVDRLGDVAEQIMDRGADHLVGRKSGYL